MKAEELRAYCSEADVFLELFAARCESRGLHVTFAGNPMEIQSRRDMRHGHMRAASEDGPHFLGTRSAYWQRVCLKKLDRRRGPRRRWMAVARAAACRPEPESEDFLLRIIRKAVKP
eukprot:3232940-Prymnesium_polylepis.1